MSRQLYLLGVGIVLVALAFAVTEAVLGPRPGITEANARRIRPGMMLREAEAILGKRGLCGGTFVSRGGRGSSLWLWDGADGTMVFILTDATDRIGTVTWIPGSESRSGPMARLRAWLGW
jgi:hypothetical protein